MRATRGHGLDFSSTRNTVCHYWISAQECIRRGKRRLGGHLFFYLFQPFHREFQVIEYRVQYDGDGSDAATAACKTSVNGTPTACVINITVNARMVAPVYVYYELQNFYQNHRRYVKSRNDNQLLGTVYTSTSDSSLSFKSLGLSTPQ